MITAVDSNVVFDLILEDAYADRSQAALVQALSEGRCVISEAVFAELSAKLDGAGDLDRLLVDLGVQLAPSTRAVLATAGRAWWAYTARRPKQSLCATCGESFSGSCPACGAVREVREHVLADFLIGAHASLLANRLLTRDRGVFRRYFKDLAILVP